MRFFKRYRFVLLFLLLLVFCSVMVIRQFRINREEHVELREAFILLYIRGYGEAAQKIYERLINDAYRQDTAVLLDDLQRTLLLIDPLVKQTNNLIYDYHWTVSLELDKRSEGTLKRALDLAKESEKSRRP